MVERTAEEWIAALGLAAHPEGGWFRETYRARESIPADALPARYAGPRSFGTSILFLLRAGEVSSLHRIASDEVWHHHRGGALCVHGIDAAVTHRKWLLGADLDAGQSLQVVVPAGTWFGAEVLDGAFALVGCTVAPGFDFADFELADRATLGARYPQHRALIEKLTR